MRFMFAPLNRHIDSGFGATGDAFLQAAKKIDVPEGAGHNSHLPVAFLYRHAVELFLKSIILILHRSLMLPYGTEPFDGEPRILIGSKWQPLFTVHRVGYLFSYFKKLLCDNRATIRAKASTPWDDTPPQLDVWIAEIDRVDSSSTFFRYPVTRHADDGQKSLFQAVDDPETILSGPPAITMLVVDDDRRVLEAFSSQGEPMPETHEVLRRTAELLNGAQFGMRTELADGW